MIGADEVLARGVVDADFSTDRAVDLREERRRDLDDGHAAEVRGRGEPGDVADDSSAHGHDRRRAIGRGPNQRVVDPSHRRELFEAFAVGNEDRFLRGQPFEPVGVKAPHGGIRDDEAPARRAERIDDADQARRGAIGDVDGIGAGWCSDVQGVHGFTGAQRFKGSRGSRGFRGSRGSSGSLGSTGVNAVRGRSCRLASGQSVEW